MIKIISWCLFVLLISCTSHSKKFYTSKSIPAADLKQARNVIQNQLSFLHLLFEQSKDPYYNVPKWSDECLAENKIGRMVESQKPLQALSLLYLDRSKEFGQCSHSAETYLAYVLYIFCEDQHQVREVIYPVDKNPAPEKLNLCQ